MPLYDYRCAKCKKTFELLILKGTVPACPTCKSEKIEQQVSTFAVASSDMTRTRVAAARKKYKASKEFKDKQVHEAEVVRDHYNEHH